MLDELAGAGSAASIPFQAPGGGWTSATSLSNGARRPAQLSTSALNSPSERRSIRARRSSSPLRTPKAYSPASSLRSSVIFRDTREDAEGRGESSSSPFPAERNRARPAQDSLAHPGMP